MDLRSERKRLGNAVSNSYSPTSFPGSAAWRVNFEARQALDSFDAAHPEIIAEINAEIKAARQARRAAYLAGEVDD